MRGVLLSHWGLSTKVLIHEFAVAEVCSKITFQPVREAISDL